MMSSLTVDKKKFIQSAEAHWQALRERNVDLANAETAAGGEIVRRWVDAGKAVEFLEPLLSDDSLEVQFAAASHLYTLGHVDLAIPVLQKLQEAKTGFVAMSARLILMRHRHFPER